MIIIRILSHESRSQKIWRTPPEIFGMCAPAQSAVQLANGSQLAVFNPQNSSHIYYSCMYLVVYKY
jgi:hypothetical protein